MSLDRIIHEHSESIRQVAESLDDDEARLYLLLISHNISNLAEAVRSGHFDDAIEARRRNRAPI